jgi:hypothetical protein
VQSPPRPSDTLSVDELAWTFVRGDEDKERLTIVRDASSGPPGVRLMIIVDGSTRSFDFVDVMAAVRFQCDMEAFLLKSGWSFISFAPEQRTNRDRRSFPRLRERRRWWTDGTVTLKQFLDRDDVHWPAEPPSGGRKRDGG